MHYRLRALWSDELGLTSVEYALLLATVTVVAIGSFAYLGSRMENTAENSAGVISAADESPPAPMMPTGY